MYINDQHPTILSTNPDYQLIYQSQAFHHVIFWHSFRNLLNFINSNRTIPSYTLYIRHNNCLSSKTHIYRDVNCGWIIWYLHTVEHPYIFICLLIRVGCGLCYGAYTFLETWNMKIILLFIIIATAFIGFVKPNILLRCNSPYKSFSSAFHQH